MTWSGGEYPNMCWLSGDFQALQMIPRGIQMPYVRTMQLTNGE